MLRASAAATDTPLNLHGIVDDTIGLRVPGGDELRRFADVVVDKGEGERQRAGGRGSAGEGERQRAGGRGSAGEGERQRAGGRGSADASRDAARAAVDAAIGDGAADVAAAVAANFQMMNRLLDATGVPVPAARAELGRTLGVARG